MAILQEIVGRTASDASPIQVLFNPDDEPVLYCTLPGGESVIRACQQLQRFAHLTRHWPILLGDEKRLGNLRELPELNPGTVQETLEFANTIDPKKWFADRERERRTDFEEYNPGEDPSNAVPPLGEWPDDPQPHSYISAANDVVSREPLASVVIAFIPTLAHWEVPARLHIGGWNECPEAAVHCALHRHWQEEFGTRIFAVTSDTIEFLVERPPQTKERALDLAKEQYLYCADIVEQGTETLSRLASGLLDGKTWFFWWD
jgi:hypothetical protein